MPFQSHSSPYADMLALRDAKRLNRVAPALSIPRRILDNGNPSDAAMRARDQRVALAARQADIRDATAAARGDYTSITNPDMLRGFTTKRGR